jgi:hypothetical protein
MHEGEEGRCEGQVKDARGIYICKDNRQCMRGKCRSGVCVGTS